MKKKAIALMLAAAMTMTALAGCGSSSGTTTAGSHCTNRGIRSRSIRNAPLRDGYSITISAVRK